MDEIVVDSEITIRPRSVDHADEMFAAIDRQRDYLSEFLPWVEGTKTVDDTIAWAGVSYDPANERGGIIFYRDLLAGGIEIRGIASRNHSANIGYWLDRDLQGRGIVTRCCRRLIEIGFTECGLNRVEIKAAVNNTRSREIAERLGFSREGVLRQSMIVAGRPLDMAVFSLLRPEWERRKEARRV